MKEKVITIKPKGITQKQWSILLLELNMIKNKKAYDRKKISKSSYRDS